jgi:hypothetical protein
MFKSQKLRACALFGVVSVAALAVSGFNSRSATIGLTAEVPLVCNVALQGGNAQFDANGVALLGTTTDFCNKADGYRLIARATGDVAGGRLLVDGRSFPLTANAEFELAASPTAARTGRTIHFDAGSTDGGGQLSLRIVANYLSSQDQRKALTSLATVCCLACGLQQEPTHQLPLVSFLMADVVTSPKPSTPAQPLLIGLGLIGAIIAATSAFVLLPKPAGMDVPTPTVAVSAAVVRSTTETGAATPKGITVSSVSTPAQAPVIAGSVPPAQSASSLETAIVAQPPTPKNDKVPSQAPNQQQR